MAFSVPYLVISPTALLSMVGLLIGPDKTIATPAEDWKKAIVDVIIPARNEEKNIILCLASLTKQTLKPRRIFVCDDASSDYTVAYAKKFGQTLGIECVVISKEKAEGKTAFIKQITRKSDSDVIFVLDGDTILRSDNYIESLVKELYQGIGNASTCGNVLPLQEEDKDRVLHQYDRRKLEVEYPSIKKVNLSWFDEFQYKLTRYYREELYLYLEKFIYHAEMIFFGSVVNPIGCAVAYRREYLSDLFNYYEKDLGDNLTTSEDIFIGFAFINAGFKNILVQGIYALTIEPKISKLPAQLFNWSSSYMQSCYYFNDLVSTPFKVFKVIWKNIKTKFSEDEKKKQNLRKIKEPYRQVFGAAVTKKFGRPVGWYIFTALFEKCSFPFILLLMIYFGWWEVLAFTIVAEVFLYSSLIFFFHRNRRWVNIVKSILLTPIRYMVLLFDIVVLSNFVKDIYFTDNRKWTK